MKDIKISTPIMLIITAILAWFVYGTINGVFSMVLLDIILSISLIIAMIPIVGIFIMMMITEIFTIPMILSFTNIEYTWLVTAMKVVTYIIGTIITLVTTIWILNKT